MNSLQTRKRFLFCLIFLAILAFGAGLPPGEEEVSYRTGSWDAEELGNHRAVIRVSEKSGAVWVRIPWQRRDFNPEKKNIVIIDAATETRLKNVCPVDINREFGDILFEPQTTPGEYFVYYMPYISSGSQNYPKVTYQEPENTADSGWLARNGLKPYGAPIKKTEDFPKAQVIEIQSIDEFNSFFPMEVIATAEETQMILEQYPDAPFLLFPEDRKFPVRMTDDLPLKWAMIGPQKTFAGEAARGEFYVFQIGVYACRQAIEDIDVSFNDLKIASGNSAAASIPASLMHSFNTGGVNWDGKEFKKVCAVPKGKVQPLWCGIQIPENILPGKYEGEVTVIPKGMSSDKVKVVVNVTDEILKDAGDSQLWRLSRLRWLDSRIAFDDDIVPPYTPLSVKGDIVSCLGRSLTFDKTGFPKSIKSYFSEEVTAVGNQPRELLASPVGLFIMPKTGTALKWEGKSLKITKQKPGAVAWEAESQAGPFTLHFQAQMEFDGFVEFKVQLTSSAATEINDIRLEIPLARDVAKYMMGLGFKGGFCPPLFEWKWGQTKNQDAVWIGDVNAGLQVSFRDESYSRPLNTNFYLSKPLNMPPSWYNEGKGGCRISESSNNTVLITTFSGPRLIKPGESLHFNFNLLLTPFKPLDTTNHFKTRFFHAYKPIEEIAKTGANTINNHHANEINPYINYPFLCTQEMKHYIDEAHSRGFKVKIYYTIRELSNRAAELFALRSLGDEIFSRGPGGGFSWLQEHLGSNYIAAWFVPQLKDAAIINSGMSRWHNYYLEGLNWLTKNIGIDGLYIDDVAFDRTTMKRVRKILDRNRSGSLIDLHSANQYNVRDGFASSANLYLEHFPYLNRLWFGEYFDCNSAPDYWLIEMSGIPFGLMGEMLQDGGNPWRGMIYGMTNRLPWSGKNPAHLWKVWDEFGIENSRMIGYWTSGCPVKPVHKDVLATAYVKKGNALISVASWAKEAVNCRLDIDWKMLGLNPEKSVLYAPAIPEFQEEATFKPGDVIRVEPGKGWLLVLKESSR